MIRAVVDTVVFVRGTLSRKGKSAFVIQAFKQQKFLLITSRDHVEEVFHTLGYPRLRRKYNLTDRRCKKLAGQIAVRGVVLSPFDSIAICRDPDDDYLIEIALLGQADYLVTEDNDLLGDEAVVQFLAERGIKVARVDEFVRALGE
jgi:putative PIN family toxin of toxin-antitoxin system